MTRHLIGALAGAAALAALACGGAAAAELEHVTVGGANSISDVAVFIADDNGYFRDEGIEIAFTGFQSGAVAQAPLASGELDVYGGTPSAGLYNAVARGIKIRIVADKASSQPGYPVNRVLVRKDLVESGRYKTLKDLKGMKFAMTGPGLANQVSLNDALTLAGLKWSDVTTVDMSFPEHVTALANKAVDGGDTTEPSATFAIERGYAVPVARDDETYPGHEIAVLIYSEKFATERRATGIRFMRAYLRGVRYYHDALKDGHLAGPNAAEVIKVLTKYTPMKDPAAYRAIIPNGCDPDGRYNAASLNHDLDFYRQLGLIHGTVTVAQMLDPSFVEAALKDLGPYKPGETSAGK